MGGKREAITLLSLTTGLVAYSWISGTNMSFAFFPFLVGAGVFTLAKIPFFFKIWVNALKEFGIHIKIYKKRHHIYNFVVFLLLCSLISIVVCHKVEILDDPLNYLFGECVKNGVFMLAGFVCGFVGHQVMKYLKPRGSTLSYLFCGSVITIATVVIINLMFFITSSFGIEVI